jgi:hypothetical protein
MRGRRSTDRGSESWLNDFLGVVVADSWHLRGFVAIETKKQRSVERQDEPFIEGHWRFPLPTGFEQKAFAPTSTD